MSRIRTVAGMILLGAAGFWGPDVVIAAIARGETSVWIPTAVLPITTGLAYVAGRRLFWRDERHQSLWMLTGIVFLGPSAMILATGPLSGGTPFTVHDLPYLLLFTLLPFYTAIASGYDESVFALIIVTLGLVLVHVGLERRGSNTRGPTAPAAVSARVPDA